MIFYLHLILFILFEQNWVLTTWLVEDEAAKNVEVGANDHKVGANQDEEDAFDPKPMAIETYHPLEDVDLTYSQFERMVLNQLQELNVS